VPGGDIDAESPLAISIHLVRPGNPDRVPETIEATFGETVDIRFTRATAAVERSFAIATMTGINAGRFWQREQFFTYGPDNEWHVVKPVVERGPQPRVIPDSGR
jgi:hypothetical protein